MMHMIDREQYIESTRMHLGRVKTLTDENDHSGALIQLAVVTGHGRAARVFTALKTIHGIDGEMLPDVMSVRERWRKTLLEHIDTILPELSKEVRQSI